MSVRVRYDATLGIYDINIVSGLLETDEGFETAVAISLFTDARATVEELVEAGLPQNDPRGYWVDTYVEEPSRRFAQSKLWLLSRALREDATLRRAELYGSQALKWMVDDGVASKIVTAASWFQDTGYLILQTDIQRPRDPEPRWRRFWNVTSGELMAA